MSAPAPGSIDMLKRLVAFDTTSRNSNLELIRYIQDYLDGHGVKSTLVPNAEGTKANLFATIGPDAEVLVIDAMRLARACSESLGVAIRRPSG